jgi:hypothetical protein
MVTKVDRFELGRRHKIMNPEKMRDSYGKLMYLLQDSQMHEVKELLQFSCVSPIKTVYSVLDSGNCLALLTDALIVPATKEIIAEDRSRYQIQQEIKAKERAIEQLARRYGSSAVPPDMIKQCLYSMGDNHAFLRVNRDPCDKMIRTFYCCISICNGISSVTYMCASHYRILVRVLFTE